MAKFCQECGAPLSLLQSETELESRLKALQAFIPEGLAAKIRKGKGQVEGERRFVTVMFADVSGFTAMSELMDPEDVTVLMNDCFKVLVEVVYHYEGMIDKFIGDCIMVIFGAPIAHEDDPVRAVRCAWGMKEAIQGFNARAHLPSPGLSLHIGVNSGWVIAGSVGSDLRMDYTVMGDTVNLASRLESAAQKRQVYISHRTAELVKGLFELQEVEPLSLKGKREPVRAYEVMALRTFAQPQRGLAVRSEMVGRNEELVLLKKALEEVKESQSGRVVFITGEAGVGKTRLSEEWEREALERGFRSFRGRCLSYGKAISYWPFLDLLRNAVGVGDIEGPEVLRKELKEVVSRLFPGEVGGRYPYLASLLSLGVEEEYQVKIKHLDAKALRLAQFCAVKDFLLALSREQTTLFKFEDWHWADASSVELFEFLLGFLSETPLVLLGVMRPDKDSLAWQSLESAQKRIPERVKDVSLRRLEKGEAQRMIANLVGGVPASLQTQILAKSIGNPFYVEEIIRSLMDSGVLALEEGVLRLADKSRPLTSLEIPDRLELLIASRIDRLAEETKQVLQGASVIGLSFYKRILQSIHEREKTLDEHLGYLESREFLAKLMEELEGLEYIFKHPLIQEVAYNGLLKGKRREYHRKVAERIEEIFSGRLEEVYGLLAHHYYWAEEWKRAFDYNIKAGSQAKERYNNKEGIDYLTRALKIANEKENIAGSKEIIEAYRKRGDIWNLLGQYDQAEADYKIVLRMAKDQGTRELEIEAMNAIGLFYQIKGDNKEALRLSEETLKYADDNNDKHGQAASLHIIGIVHWSLGEYPLALNYHERSLKIQEEIGDKSGQADSLQSIGNVHMHSGAYPLSLNCHERSLKIYEEIGDKRGQASSLANICSVHWSLGEYPLALKYGERSLKISEEIGYKRGQAWSLPNMGIMHLLLGDYQLALKEHERALNIFEEIGDKRGQAYSLQNIGMAQESLGECSLALNNYERALKIYEEIGDKGGQANNLHYIGNMRGHSHGNSGEKYLGLNYLERSLKIFEEIGDKRGQAGNFLNTGEVLSSLGDYRLALKYFERSLKIFEEIGEKRTQAFSLLNIGNVHYSLGEYSLALNYLEGPLKIFEEIGEKVGWAQSLDIIGNVYCSLGAYSLALNYLERSLKLSEEISNKERQAYSLGYIGNVHCSLGEYPLAQNYFERSLKISEEIGDKCLQAQGYDNFGRARLALGQYDLALEDLNRALTEARNLKLIEPEMRYLLDLGKAKMGTGDLSGALADAETVVEWAEINSVKGILAEGYLVQSRALTETEPLKSMNRLNQAKELMGSLKDPEILWQTFYQEGRIFQHQGDPIRALSCYEKCLEGFERVCANLEEEKHKESYMSDRRKKGIFEAIEKIKNSKNLCELGEFSLQ